MAKKEAPNKEVQVTIPAQTTPNEEGKVDLIVEADNVVVNTPTERVGPDSGAKAMMPEDEFPADLQSVMDTNAPQTKQVKTGTNVMTGEDVFKDVPVKQERDYSEGRKLFPVHTSVNGSYNGRQMKLVKGESIYLNERELRVFRNYVSGAGK